MSKKNFIRKKYRTTRVNKYSYNSIKQRKGCIRIPFKRTKTVKVRNSWESHFKG